VLDRLGLRRPRQRPYYDAAMEVAGRLVAAATELRALFAAPAELERRMAAIADSTREVDRITQDVRARLDRAFVTPIDREDIYDLAAELRGVAHLIGRVARRAVTYRLTEVREPAVRLADTLVRACERLGEAIAHVRAPALALAAQETVRQVEREADAIYTAAVGALFTGRPSPLEVLKWKDLYDHLEDAVDGCAHAAAVITHASIAQS
jgi:uncharacterized protein